MPREQVRASTAVGVPRIGARSTRTWASTASAQSIAALQRTSTRQRPDDVASAVGSGDQSRATVPSGAMNLCSSGPAQSVESEPDASSGTGPHALVPPGVETDEARLQSGGGTSWKAKTYCVAQYCS